MMPAATIVCKSLDAILTAQLRPRRSFVCQLRTLLRLRTSNYDRVASAVNLVDRVIPGIAKWTASFLCRPAQLPLAASKIELFAFGSGSTVFLLDTPAGRKVLKIYRRTLGAQGDGLLRLTKEFKHKHELVRSWHSGPDNPVHPASFLVLNGPMLGRSATACLQTYIPGDKRDFFSQFTDDELVDLAQHNDSLREQIIRFAEKTVAVYSEDGLCVDILGENNLMICWKQGQPRLTLIDYGIFDLPVLRKQRPEVCARIDQKIERLSRLTHLLSPS